MTLRDRRKEHAEQLSRLQQRHREIEARIDAAYDDKLNKRITDDYWTRRTNEWQKELASLKADIAQMENAKFNAFADMDAILSLVKKAPDLFISQTYEEQARLLKLINSNSTWDGVTLTPTYKKPFDLLAEGLKSSTGGADDPFNQTFLMWMNPGYAANRRISTSAPLLTACSARARTCSLTFSDR